MTTHRADSGRPEPALDARAIEAAVTAAAAAPSILNSQPWRFHVHGDDIDVFAVPERAPVLLDTHGRELHLSVGAAVLNLRLALGAAGRVGVVQMLPSALDPRLLARVRVGGPLTLSPDEQALVDAIPRRRTSREPYTDTDVPYEDFDRLQEAAAIEGAHLEAVTGLHRGVVAGAVHEADLAQRGDKSLVDEVALWTVDRPADAGVGIPTENLGPAARDPHALVRDLSFGRATGSRPIVDFEDTALLAVLLTSGDRPADWVRGGMALERVLLAATVRGLSVGLLSQATEVPDLRWLVRDPMSAWRHPQILLRLGHGEQPPPTPRLPLADVLEID